jgi:hypothetical protein
MQYATSTLLHLEAYVLVEVANIPYMQQQFEPTLSLQNHYVFLDFYSKIIQ